MYIYIYLRCDRSESEPIQTNKFPPSTTAWTLSFLALHSPIPNIEAVFSSNLHPELSCLFQGFSHCGTFLLWAAGVL